MGAAVVTATASGFGRPRNCYAPDDSTVAIKLTGEFISLLRMETKVSPYALTVAMVRVLLWGEIRHAGALMVRLPVEDVEVILDGMERIAAREDGPRQKDLRDRIRTLKGRITAQGWTITRVGDEHLLTR